jgi:hypothetical protein
VKHLHKAARRRQHNLKTQRAYCFVSDCACATNFLLHVTLSSSGRRQVRGRESRRLLNYIEATELIIRGTHTAIASQLHRDQERRKIKNRLVNKLVSLIDGASSSSHSKGPRPLVQCRFRAVQVCASTSAAGAASRTDIGSKAFPAL